MALGMGIIPFDLLYTIDKYPAPESKIDATDFFSQGGGPIPNCMVGLSRLGVTTAVIAAVGDDPFGHAMIKGLQAERVNTDYMIMKKKSPTAIATGYIEKGSGRRTMVLYRNIEVLPRDIRTNTLPIPKIIHLDGRDMSATMKLARWAKKVGAIVSFDIGSMRNDVSDVLPSVDHLVVADQFAFGFTKTRTAKAAIEKLQKHCRGTIVVTEGLKGSTGLEDGRHVHQRAFKVKNVDTTGAGDAYHSGYLYGLLRGWSLADRMEFGAAVAALKCTRPGGQSGLPTLNAAKRFLAERKKNA